MKFYDMRHCFLFTLTAAFAASSGMCLASEPEGIMEAPKRIEVRKVSKAKEGQKVTLTIPCSQSEYRLSEENFILAYNSMFSAGAESFSYNAAKAAYEAVVCVPSGVFDFAVSLNHVNPDHARQWDYSIFLIKENVEVSDDVTIIMRPSEAHNHIAFRSYNSDGSETRLPKGRYEGKDWDFQIVEDGNISSMELIRLLDHKSYGVIDYMVTSVRLVESSEVYPYRNDGEKVFDIYVNDVSSAYEFRQVRMMRMPDESSEMIVMNYNGPLDEEILVQNDCSDYYELKPQISHTPVSAIDDAAANYAVGYGATIQGGGIPGLTTQIGSPNANIHKVMVSPGESNADRPLALLSWILTDCETDSHVYKTVSPNMYVAGEEDSFFSFFTSGDYSYGFQGQYYGKFYPGHPGLAVFNDEMSVGLGQTAPISLISYKEYEWDGRTLMNFQSVSLGQIGEIRGADELATTYSLTFNGEDALKGMDLFGNWASNWMYEEHGVGKYILTAENSNYGFDDIDGHSITEVAFDTRLEDHFPPALQMLQIRDINGKISVAFDDSSEAELRIVGGDFNNAEGDPDEYGWKQSWYEIEPAELKVEYAPLGSDVFTELTGITRDDYLTYWGFADYYSVSLGDVRKNSENGWYDLRITLTDPAGNYQRQTLSPAFKINNPSGVEKVIAEKSKILYRGNVVESTDDSGYIELIDSNGRIVGKGIQVSTSGLPSGVYMARLMYDGGIESLKIVK